MQDHMSQQDITSEVLSNGVKHIAGEDAVGEGTRQFLTFVLNSKVYGIDILRIKEIIAHGNITRVPMMPEFIAGVISAWIEVRSVCLCQLCEVSSRS